MMQLAGGLCVEVDEPIPSAASITAFKTSFVDINTSMATCVVHRHASPRTEHSHARSSDAFSSFFEDEFELVAASLPSFMPETAETGFSCQNSGAVLSGLTLGWQGHTADTSDDAAAPAWHNPRCSNNRVEHPVADAPHSNIHIGSYHQTSDFSTQTNLTNLQQSSPSSGPDSLSNWPACAPETAPQPWNTTQEHDLPQAQPPIVGPSAQLQSTSGISQTVDDDSDSSSLCDKGQGIWSLNMLSLFDNNPSRISLLTPPLSGAEWREVHNSCYNLMHMSTLSLGTGREKNMLITKCHIRSVGQVPVRGKIYNPPDGTSINGFVDPRFLIVQNISQPLTEMELGKLLLRSGLAVPQVTCFRSLGDSGFLHMFFEDPGAAANVLVGLHGTYPDWNAKQQINCDYLHFPETWGLNSRELQKIDSLIYSIAWHNHRVSSSGYSSSVIAEHLIYGYYLHCYQNLQAELAQQDDIMDLDLDLDMPGVSDMQSTLMPLGLDGTTQATNPPNLQDLTNSSLTHKGTTLPEPETTSRRKPRKAGAFPCVSPDCDRVFDRECDRRKHEGKHLAERAHRCGISGSGFRWPKDLRRHQRTHT